MGSKYRKLFTGFWEDPDVEAVFDKDDRYFYLFLMTNPKSTQWGVYELTPKYVADKTGFSLDEATEMLYKFEVTYNKIVYSKKTHEVCIRNALKWNADGTNPSVVKHIVNGLKSVKDKSLLSSISGIKDALGKYEFASDILIDADKYAGEFGIVEPIQHAKVAVNAPRCPAKKPTATSDSVPIPEELLASNGFKEAWMLFLDYRKKDKKKPVSPMQATELLNELREKYIDGTIEPAKIIKKSIANGWQGLFFDGGERVRGRRPKRITEQTSYNDASEGQVI